MIGWMQIYLGIKINLFLKVIEIDLDLKFKIYLKFLTQNIMNVFKNWFDYSLQIINYFNRV